MSHEPPTIDAEESIANFEAKADYWENFARTADPDAALFCRDYAAHLRTLAEIVRQDMLEQQVAMLCLRGDC
jgi:hypothetical protein